jgi:glycosyltransferase involved in cell wall biosynthesis
VFDPLNRCSADHGDHAASEADRPNIAIVAPSLDVLGGQSIQAAAIRDGLAADGFHVRLLPANPRFPHALQWVRRIPVARTLLNQTLYLWSLRRLRAFDVVHVFSASYWSFLLAPVPAMLAARVFGKRVILNYHSGEAADHLTRWGLLVHPWLRLAHELVVPSEYLRRVFHSHGYEARVIHNVVDTGRFAFRARSPLSPRLLSTRNLEPGYRVDVLIDAFVRLRKERPDASLVIAGSGSEEGRLRQHAHGIAGITFLGRVAPEEMPSVCAASDIFLNASEIDNQPLSLLEAFASGLPVVTTPSGGIAHMVRNRETALVVPTRDPDAIAAAVLALLRDPDLAKRLADNARLASEEYSWAGVRRLWARAYSHDAFESPVSGAVVSAPSRSGLTAGPSASSAKAVSFGKERSC